MRLPKLVDSAYFVIESSLPGIPTLRAAVNNVFAKEIYSQDGPEIEKPFSKVQLLSLIALDFLRTGLYFSAWPTYERLLEQKLPENLGLLAIAILPFAAGIAETLIIRHHLWEFSGKNIPFR